MNGQKNSIIYKTHLCLQLDLPGYKFMLFVKFAGIVILSIIGKHVSFSIDFENYAGIMSTHDFMSL